jgi:superfamily II DNA or RNA helicase
LKNTLNYTINGKELFDSKEITLGNMYYSLWDFQKDAVQSWFDKGSCGIIKAPTGSGKGIMGCAVIKQTGVRTIICVHTSDLLINVWHNYLCEQFGAGIKSRLGIIGGGLSKKDRKMMKICGDDFEENIRKDIVIATSQSLLNRLDRIGSERFGLLIVDELHHYPSEQFRKITNAIRAKARLGLSATLVRPDGMSPMMQGLIGDVVYRIGIKELVNRGLLVEPIFNSIIIQDNDCIDKISSAKYVSTQLARYVKRVSGSSEKKKDYVIELCNSLVLNQKKFMMYTDWVSGGDGVYTRDDYVSILREMGIRVIGVSAEMSSTGREEVFRYLKEDRIDGIIFGSLGNEGINIPAVECVIMCNATASTIRFPQRVGRGMRISPGKRNCFVYEILLNTEKELEWSNKNFYEYKTEGYKKEKIWIGDDGKVLKKEFGL